MLADGKRDLEPLPALLLNSSWLLPRLRCIRCPPPPSLSLFHGHTPRTAVEVQNRASSNTARRRNRARTARAGNRGEMEPDSSGSNNQIPHEHQGLRSFQINRPGQRSDQMPPLRPSSTGPAGFVVLLTLIKCPWPRTSTDAPYTPVEIKGTAPGWMARSAVCSLYSECLDVALLSGTVLHGTCVSLRLNPSAASVLKEKSFHPTGWL